MSTVFIITGETGEYEMIETWKVCAFLDKTSCEEHLNRLNQYLIDNNIPTSNVYISESPSFDNKLTLKGLPIDEELREHFDGLTGVEYGIEELPLLE